MCVHVCSCWLLVLLSAYNHLCGHSSRYSSEGRVTNITHPTGEVNGFRSNLERWSRVEVEASTRENFVTSTNLSASDTIYTFRQGITAGGAICSTGTLEKPCGGKKSRNGGKQMLTLSYTGCQRGKIIASPQCIYPI